MKEQLPTPTPSKHRSVLKPIVIAIALIFISLILFHLFFPILGAAVLISAAAWAVIIASVVIFCVFLLLFFIFSGAFATGILGIIALIWLIIALIIFPIIFPLIMPIFIILVAIGYILRHRK